MKIANVVGARPNLVKIAPLLREMKKYPGINAYLIHTGQHYDQKLSDVFFRQMGIPEPDINLEVGSGTQASQTAEILRKIEPILIEQRPDAVLVVGDVNSTVAASLAAAKLSIPIVHVEAGLRSFDRTMPEEVNRVVTDALADFLFVTEADAVENLVREGRSRDRIFMVGNVMIDALTQFLPAARKSNIGEHLKLLNDGTYRPFALLTLHRPSNVDSRATLQILLDAVDKIADRVELIFPVHPRTQQRIQQMGNQAHSKLQLIPPLGYIDFLCLLSHARLVLTDSGGVQEETTALGVPCLTLRENTERPVTVSEGTNQIVGGDPVKITEAAFSILEGKTKPGKIPSLWDGKAAERIVQVLVQELGRN